MCQQGEQLQLEPHELGPSGWVYALRLVLADGSGELEVVALAKEAELLFGPGMPPADLAADQDAACRLRARLLGLQQVELLGGGEAAAGVLVAGEEAQQAGTAAGTGGAVSGQVEGCASCAPAGGVVHCTWLDCCVRHVVYSGMSLFRLEATRLRELE
jgi:hypothetical protein